MGTSSRDLLEKRAMKIILLTVCLIGTTLAMPSWPGPDDSYPPSWRFDFSGPFPDDSHPHRRADFSGPFPDDSYSARADFSSADFSAPDYPARADFSSADF